MKIGLIWSYKTKNFCDGRSTIFHRSHIKRAIGKHFNTSNNNVVVIVAIINICEPKYQTKLENCFYIKPSSEKHL